MKNLLPRITLTLALTLALPLALPASDDPNLMGKVMSNTTIKACVQTAKQQNSGLDTVLQSQTTSTCFAGGTFDSVTIFQVGRCQPNVVCKVIAVLVATADVGCEGEITNVTCYVN